MINLSKAFENLVWLNAFLPRILWKDGRALDPIHIFLEVTYHCNLRCNFCQYLDIIKGEVATVGPVKQFTTEEIKGTIDQFPRGRLITFTGGEVLVRKDFPEILEYAGKRHRTHIVSNGALINDDVARHFINLAPRRVWQNGLILIGISMEGDEAYHDEVVQRSGSWQRTVTGIRRMVQLRREAGKKFPKFNLKMVITRDTVHGMIDHMLLAKELGVDIVNFLAEHDLMGNSATLTSTPEEGRIHVEQPRPKGVDPLFLREQLVRCFEMEKELGLQIRTTPANLPIDEFVRHYTDDRHLSPDEYVCEGPWSRLCLGADGRFLLCPYLRVGDSRIQTIGEVWNGEAFKKFRRDVGRDRIYAGCHGCCNLKYTGPKEYGLAGIQTRADHPSAGPPGAD
jgi:MoaA/NifB/PqqE/SkfB family radical SAM enzyme